MKISNKNMKKLGFFKCGSWWQHKNYHDLTFNVINNGNPQWEKILSRAFELGEIYGKREAQSEIKKAIGF